MPSLTGIPVNIYRGRVRIKYSSFPSFPVNPILFAEKKFFSLKDNLGYFYVEDFYYYVYLKTKDHVTIVLGPSRFLRQERQERMDLALRLGMEGENLQAFADALGQLVPFPMESLLQVMLALNLVLNGEKRSLSEILLSEASDDSGKETKEEKKPAIETEENVEHNTIDAEKELLSFISHGDRTGLETYIRNLNAIRPGLLSTNALRERKNLFVVIATLASRAAIDGGLEVEEAFTLSDLYIQRSEMMNRPEEIDSLISRMLIDDTDRVRKFQIKGFSELEKEVYFYVRKHISEHITLNQMADDLFRSRSRLCAAFKKETGKTIKEFIMEEKIKEGRKLLLGKDKSLSQISAYLGFCSQSYFTIVFTRFVGMSPTEYIGKNRK